MKKTMNSKLAAAANRGNYQALETLVLRHLKAESEHKVQAAEVFWDIIRKYGPVVDSYPIWHPLVHHIVDDLGIPRLTPNRDFGYKGLDHTIYLKNGFITCPYHDGQGVIDSVNNLPGHLDADINAKRLNISLYADNTETVLVTCDWYDDMLDDGTIPPSVAVPLFLERLLRFRDHATVAESWERLAEVALGTPCNKTASLFVNEETGKVMRKFVRDLNDIKVFGELYRDVI